MIIESKQVISRCCLLGLSFPVYATQNAPCLNKPTPRMYLGKASNFKYTDSDKVITAGMEFENQYFGNFILRQLYCCQEEENATIISC